jgi:hypothetical protein
LYIQFCLLHTDVCLLLRYPYCLSSSVSQSSATRHDTTLHNTARHHTLPKRHHTTSHCNVQQQQQLHQLATFSFSTPSPSTRPAPLTSPAARCVILFLCFVLLPLCYVLLFLCYVLLSLCCVLLSLCCVLLPTPCDALSMVLPMCYIHSCASSFELTKQDLLRHCLPYS